MILLSMFGFLGCQSKDQKAEQRILEALQEKYGEEFVLDSIGGGYGTMNNNTWKAKVYPKKDKTMWFTVEVTKDLKNVYDKYLNEVIARNAQQTIEELAKGIWSDAKVDITNDTKMTYPEHSDTNMSYEEFLKNYPMNTQLVSVYLNADGYMDQEGNMDQDAEYEKYLAFADLLIENKYVSSLVGINYVSPDAYIRLEESKESDVSVNILYMNEEKKEDKLNFVTLVGYEILKDGHVKEDREEVYRYFDIWKEKREKYIKKRGNS